MLSINWQLGNDVVTGLKIFGPGIILSLLGALTLRFRVIFTDDGQVIFETSLPFGVNEKIKIADIVRIDRVRFFITSGSNIVYGDRGKKEFAFQSGFFATQVLKEIYSELLRRNPSIELDRSLTV